MIMEDAWIRSGRAKRREPRDASRHPRMLATTPSKLSFAEAFATSIRLYPSPKIPQAQA
jgi:hypothetical protein